MAKKPLALKVRLSKGRIKPDSDKFSTLMDGVNATTMNPDATLILLEFERFKEILERAERRQPEPGAEA